MFKSSLRESGCVQKNKENIVITNNDDFNSGSTRLHILLFFTLFFPIKGVLSFSLS
jgi:hypothetical protein